MAGKVFFSVSMSLDGFIAPEAVPVVDVFSPFFRVLLDKAATNGHSEVRPCRSSKLIFERSY